VGKEVNCPRECALVDPDPLDEYPKRAPECAEGCLLNKRVEEPAPHRCLFCGAPSWVDPSDQHPPPGECHESDHGGAFS